MMNTDSARPAATALDVAAVGARFPLLVEERGREKPLVYLDNAATTQKPESVLGAMELFYRRFNANPLRGSYRLGQDATKVYGNARKAVARFLNCHTEEVVFTSGATDALNLVAQAYGMSALEPGDEVVLPISEHHSSLLPWQEVARAKGAKLVYVFPDKRGHFTEEAWQQALSPRTKVVAVAHVSNVLGTVAPLARITEMAHAVGAVVVADLAQSVAHMPVDVHELDVDFAAFSAHKMYGPMGVGVLFGKRTLLEAMEPVRRGGGMVDTVYEQRATFAEVPARFEAGTPNVGGALGLAEAIGFVGAMGFDAVQAHEQALLEQLLSGLAAIPSAVVYGEPDAASDDEWSQRCGVVSFGLKGTQAVDIARVLARDEIAVRAGALCAEPLVRYLGQRGLCRVSVAAYTTAEEIDRFLEAVEMAKRAITVMMVAGMR